MTTTKTTQTTLRTHTLHNGTTLTATLHDGGLVETRFADVALGYIVNADESDVTGFWLRMVGKATKGGG